ncbi:uncharacterized protein [Ovis canadensis]|uniref:uncharacterized protein isoform X2 n=1 Tax=Ovis canadensis TaxID=37174 RepID=UPI003753833F
MEDPGLVPQASSPPECCCSSGRKLWRILTAGLGGPLPGSLSEHLILSGGKAGPWLPVPGRGPGHVAGRPGGTGGRRRRPGAAEEAQLQTRLRNDAENRVPPSPTDRVPLNPGDQLGRYLAELAEAMDHGLGPQRAARLGACLSATDRECFQEVLLGRLSVLLTRSGDPDSCRELYTWARKTLFGQLARKTPRPAAARKLLDPLMFVTWMSQVQSRLVELIQKELEKQLENVLTCDQKERASSSCQAFLKIFQG